MGDRMLEAVDHCRATIRPPPAGQFGAGRQTDDQSDPGTRPRRNDLEQRHQAPCPKQRRAGPQTQPRGDGHGGGGEEQRAQIPPLDAPSAGERRRRHVAAAGGAGRLQRRHVLEVEERLGAQRA